MRSAFRFAILLTVLACAPSTQGRVIHVPGEAGTIQAGIDIASEGDTVLVADGTYTGTGNQDIDFGGKNIVLKSENGPEVTIVDCEADSLVQHRGFLFVGGEDSTAVLDGFTIKNGFVGVGGGVYCDGSGPAITHNIIISNTAYSPHGSKGGGIYCFNSDAIIRSNTISDNRASEDGGGIYIYGGNLRIVDNIISGNSVSLYSAGGIFCHASGAIITGNTISGNTAPLRGGGFVCSTSDATVTDNTFSYNSAIRGGGINCVGLDPSATIRSNVFNHNSAVWGGGINVIWSSPLVDNNTFCGNSASSAGAVLRITNAAPPLVLENCILAYNLGSETIATAYDGATPILTCCNLFGNDGGDWTGIIADQAGVNGNFSEAPLFCDTAAGDYHLSAWSPCAAGNNPWCGLVGALVAACDPYVCGDADGDGHHTVADLGVIRSFYFEHGDWPTPLGAGDINCNGSVGIEDMIYLADYFFRDGPAPCCP